MKKGPLLQKILPTISLLMLFLSSCFTHRTTTSFNDNDWAVSYQAGYKDVNGKFMGGAELSALVTHNHKLYAGCSFVDSFLENGCWKFNGAQIVVKESAESPWKLDHQFDYKQESIECLASVPFSADMNGKRLSAQASLLVAAVYNPFNEIAKTALYTRNDTNGQWVKTLLKKGMTAKPCAIGHHHDSLTGRTLVFLGTDSSGVFSGVYDPSEPGSIKWNETPEFSDYTFQPSSFAECNGSMYVAIKSSIFRRIDGNSPRWEKVFAYPDPGQNIYKATNPHQLITYGGGIRGMITVTPPDKKGEKLIIALEGKESTIVSLDPANNFNAKTELTINKFLSKQWGNTWILDGQPQVLLPINEITEAAEPQSGGQALLIGIMAEKNDSLQKNSAWFLVRHANGSYNLHEIPSIPDPARKDPRLLSCRTIKISPFESDHGNAIYFGGYGAGGLFRLTNTAWIYRTTLHNALASKSPAN